MQNSLASRTALFAGIAGLICFSSYAAAQTVPVSKYGPDDRLGAINNLSEEIVARAAGLIKTGKVYSLAVETKIGAGAPTPRFYRVFLQSDESWGSNKLTAFEDTVAMSPSMGTSLDGLGHVGRDGVHYNGVRAEDIYSWRNGAKVFGIEKLPPIVTRGILLDVVRHREQSAGTAINTAQIEAIAKAQGVMIRRGDVVLLHTGVGSTKDAQRMKGAGLGKDGARYLGKLGVVAVGSDSGPEVSPEETQGEIAPVHQILLVDHGVYILEGVQTQELAADRVYEFLFILAAPRLAGTVQATIHPIAIR